MIESRATPRHTGTANTQSDTHVRLTGMDLVSIRRLAGNTQASIAKRMHSNQGAISRLERSTNPRMSTVLRYLDAIGATNTATTSRVGETTVTIPFHPATERHSNDEP